MVGIDEPMPLNEHIKESCGRRQKPIVKRKVYKAQWIYRCEEAVAVVLVDTWCLQSRAGFPSNQCTPLLLSVTTCIQWIIPAGQTVLCWIVHWS